MKSLDELLFDKAAQVALVVKNTPAYAGGARDPDSIAGLEDALEEGVATHSSIRAWKLPRTEEPVRLQSMGSHRVGGDCRTHTFMLFLSIFLSIAHLKLFQC